MLWPKDPIQAAEMRLKIEEFSKLLGALFGVIMSRAEDEDKIKAFEASIHLHEKIATESKGKWLDGSDKIVQKVVDLVKYFDVAFFMENPQTGLLKSRDVVKGIPFKTIDYCQYANDEFPGRYRKRTAIWTNTNWTPARALCNPKTCHFCTNGKHDHACQQRSNLIK